MSTAEEMVRQGAGRGRMSRRHHANIRIHRAVEACGYSVTEGPQWDRRMVWPFLRAKWRMSRDGVHHSPETYAMTVSRVVRRVEETYRGPNLCQRCLALPGECQCVAQQAPRPRRDPALIQPEETPMDERHPGTEHLRKFFVYEHLPSDLQAFSKPFGDLAEDMIAKLPDGPELSAGLRKLLEAKDCMVRAALALRE